MVAYAGSERGCQRLKAFFTLQRFCYRLQTAVLKLVSLAGAVSVIIDKWAQANKGGTAGITLVPMRDEGLFFYKFIKENGYGQDQYPT
jgi:hypothetical protein